MGGARREGGPRVPDGRRGRSAPRAHRGYRASGRRAAVAAGRIDESAESAGAAGGRGRKVAGLRAPTIFWVILPHRPGLPDGRQARRQQEALAGRRRPARGAARARTRPRRRLSARRDVRDARYSSTRCAWATSPRGACGRLPGRRASPPAARASARWAATLGHGAHPVGERRGSGGLRALPGHLRHCQYLRGHWTSGRVEISTRRALGWPRCAAGRRTRTRSPCTRSSTGAISARSRRAPCACSRTPSGEATSIRRWASRQPPDGGVARLGTTSRGRAGISWRRSGSGRRRATSCRTGRPCASRARSSSTRAAGRARGRGWPAMRAR